MQVAFDDNAYLYESRMAVYTDAVRFGVLDLNPFFKDCDSS